VVGRRPAFRACAVVATAYVGFGLWALFYRGFHLHFLGFIVLGLIVAVPLLLARSPFDTG
jgi:hypothetical protein